ncbi:hypothetical protein [Aquabacter cavernae]|uniref:hypothetical protein n=1 Tax=Aquabacter cavernae TaxID=2496029 RepID=UPI000F8E7B46|nr:hypothetical protein [Aquabacter cavernae]
MTEQEEREALIERIRRHLDTPVTTETLDELRWIAETLDRGARLIAERGRLGAVWADEVDGTDDPATDGHQRPR